MSAGERELRIGDQEREGAVAALGEHYAAGRLTKEEYDERAAVAYGAKTESSLRPLFVDLPGPHPFAVASAPFTGAPGAGSARSAGQRSGPTGAGGWAPIPSAGSVRRPGFRMPLLPFVCLVVGLAILLGAPWLLFIGLGMLFFARAHRRGAGWSGCGSSTMHGRPPGR